MNYLLFIKTKNFEDTFLFFCLEFKTKSEAIAYRNELMIKKIFFDDKVIYTNIKEGKK
jgi:hypothetical protein